MKNLLTLLVPLLFFTACKKKEFVSYLLPETKASFSFKSGSYWIYRDSISGRLDSCYFEKKEFYISPASPTHEAYENLRISLIQKPIDLTVTEKINWNLWFMMRGLSIQYEKQFTSKDSIGHFGMATLYPIPEDTVSYDNVDYYQIPSFVLGGNVFSNVGVVAPEGINGTRFYINASVGVIKMRIYNGIGDDKINEVWELQRWNVIR